MRLAHTPPWSARAAAGLATWLLSTSANAAALEPHPQVHGGDVAGAEVQGPNGSWRPIAWDGLGSEALDPGTSSLRIRFDSPGPDDAVILPVCAGRGEVRMDGHSISTAVGPVVIPVTRGSHEVTVRIRVTAYERRIACGSRPQVGPSVQTVEGLGLLRFASPQVSHGGGEAVIFIPPGHDSRRAAPVLVGAHPWNGSIWTYSAYSELLGEARDRDVVLLMPSGLGNSLYTADAEAEVLRAIDALASVVAVDSQAVSIWGASMGGAGATTIAFHHPDRFATVTSFFGDSRYDLSTYVRGILRDDAAAHRVNALDVVENARHLPVWLIHGEADRTSSIEQSAMLAAALEERGFSVHFDRIAGVGHSGALVARFLRELVARAASARIPHDITRVSYRSVGPADTGAYGIGIERERIQGDAFVDIEKRTDGLHVLRANNVAAIHVAAGALMTSKGAPPPVRYDGPRTIPIRWDAAP